MTMQRVPGEHEMHFLFLLNDLNASSDQEYWRVALYLCSIKDGLQVKIFQLYNLVLHGTIHQNRLEYYYDYILRYFL